MDKLRFFALQLTDSGLHQITSTVPYYLTPTSQATPQIVGIPLSHALKPPDAYADLAKQVTRMRRRIESLPTTTILALRSLWAFILSQLDYIASGVAIPPGHIEDLAIQLWAYYRHVLGLPCWTSRALLALPLSYGGPGCPHLPLRSACLLLLTYTQATCSRSLLAHRSARYLAETIDGPSLLQQQLSNSRQAETTPRCASVGQAEVGPSPPPQGPAQRTVPGPEPPPPA